MRRLNHHPLSTGNWRQAPAHENNVKKDCYREEPQEASTVLFLSDANKKGESGITGFAERKAFHRMLVFR